RERQEHLAQLIEGAPSDEVRFLLMGERARVRQLCDEGLREPKSLNIFVTYRARVGGHHQHWLDTALAKLDELWQQYSGQSQRIQEGLLKRLLRRAWGRGFIYWKQILENKLKLRILPMGPQSMWKYLWERLNPLEMQPIDLPQQVIVNTKGGLEEQIHSPVHGASLLIGDREPTYNREWVRVGGKYVGILTFWDKPGGWKDKQSQLRYLWDLVAQRLVTDTEIVTQLVPASQKKMAWSMGRLTKQSTAKAKSREQKNDVDVASKLKARRGEEAQERLLLGEMPFYVATVILVKRQTLEELEEACGHIESCFHRPAVVRRERQVAWHRWLQTLPIVDENLLGTPFIGQRLPYLSSEVPGLLPLVKTHSRDKEGLELIGEDGGTPLFLDLFSLGNDKHRHLAVFGTTRSGKSVLVGGILTQALARSIPIVAIDYPKPDGSSTYTTYTEFMGERGAYFDVGKQSVNLFDRPNLRSL
ncbi:MAG: hypothetical protein ACRDEA_11720, partial [Microcystaceae cyanobacterium]